MDVNKIFNMITMKQLNTLPTRLQMGLCNFTCVQAGLKKYTIKDILKYIDKDLFNKIVYEHRKLKRAS